MHLLEPEEEHDHVEECIEFGAGCHHLLALIEYLEEAGGMRVNNRAGGLWPFSLGKMYPRCPSITARARSCDSCTSLFYSPHYYNIYNTH